LLCTKKFDNLTLTLVAVLARALIDRREKLKEEDAEKQHQLQRMNSRASLHDDWA